MQDSRVLCCALLHKCATMVSIIMNVWGVNVKPEDLDLAKKHFTFWPHLSSADAQLLANNIGNVHYAKGETVYSAQNDCIGVLLIKSGELRAYILSEDGRDITLYRLNQGDVCILSASCLLKNITFDVHIDAEVDTEVLLVNSFVFSDLQERNIYVENYSLKIAVDKFSQVMWAMEQILFMKFDRRLATFLLDEAAKNNSDDIKLTHEQIARYMGSAREVVSRMMKHFEKSGYISLYRGGATLLDKERLRRLV